MAPNRSRWPGAADRDQIPGVSPSEETPASKSPEASAYERDYSRAVTRPTEFWRTTGMRSFQLGGTVSAATSVSPGGSLASLQKAPWRGVEEATLRDYSCCTLSTQGSTGF